MPAEKKYFNNFTLFLEYLLEFKYMPNSAIYYFIVIIHNILINTIKFH